MKRCTSLVLASASPRRKEVLRQLGIRFETVASSVEENWEDSDDPAHVTIQLAVKKVQECPVAADVVVGMDTLVVVGRRKLGKPRNASEAMEMLRALSNRMHQVITGVALRRGTRLVTDTEKTCVYFRKLTAREIDWYVKTGEPFGKAGAYAIQGLARIFINRIDGCYFNVVGFPIACFQRALGRLGLSVYSFMR